MKHKIYSIRYLKGKLILAYKTTRDIFASNKTNFYNYHSLMGQKMLLKLEDKVKLVRLASGSRKFYNASSLSRIFFSKKNERDYKIIAMDLQERKFIYLENLKIFYFDIKYYFKKLIYTKTQNLTPMFFR